MKLWSLCKVKVKVEVKASGKLSVPPPIFPFGTGWGSTLWPCHCITFESFSTVLTCELLWTLWRRQTVCVMCWQLNHDSFVFCTKFTALAPILHFVCSLYSLHFVLCISQLHFHFRLLTACYGPYRMWSI